MHQINFLYGRSYQINFLYGRSYQNNPMYGRPYPNNFLHGKTTIRLLALVTLLITGVCSANNLSTEAFYIKADEMHFDLESNSSIYKGNVTIKQGNIELSGDHVEIRQSNNAISKITASGSPAKFQQKNDNGKIMQAQSKHIKYSADENKLVMIENARLVQNEQVIESNHISYDTKKQALIAGQKSIQPDAQQRVKMTLTPTTEQ